MNRASLLSRVFLAAVLASAMGVPASAAGDHFIKLPPADGDADAAKDGHGEQIEVHSVQWGGAPASSRSFKGETIGIEPTYESSGVSKARGGTSTVDTNEKITIHGGRTESKLPGKRTPPTVTLKRGMTTGTETTGGGPNDINNLKTSSVNPRNARSTPPELPIMASVTEKGASRQATGDPDRPIIAGTAPNPSPTADRKRQYASIQAGPTPYNPKEYSVSKSNKRAAAARATPLDKGSVWVRVATPWAACRVGARYPSLELGGAGKRYVLQDVTVASCGGSRGADDRPTEDIAFYYNKIAFNYAN